MTAKLKLRGNEIFFKDNEWLYKNTGLSVAETYENTPCGNCGEKSTKEGHDACLGVLIGVMNACCGHGIENHAYIQFLDGECVNGKDAIDIIEILKKYKTRNGGFINDSKL